VTDHTLLACSELNILFGCRIGFY